MINFLEEDLVGRGQKVWYSYSTANEPEPQAWYRKVGFEECSFIEAINGEGIGEIFQKIPKK